MKKVYLIFILIFTSALLSVLACQSLHKTSSSPFSVSPIVTPTTTKTLKQSVNQPTVPSAQKPAQMPMAELPPQSPEATAIQDAIAEIKRIKTCLEKIGTVQSCQFESDDPQEWPIEISRSLVAELNALHDLYFTNDYNLSKDPQDVERLALELLRYPDDNVQLAALRLASPFPPSTETAVTVLKALDQSISVPLYEDGLQELQKFVDTPAEGKVDQLLVRALTRHNTDISAMVASQILPFLNDSNVSQFLATLNKLSPRTQAYRDLKANLDEFRREQNHG